MQNANGRLRYLGDCEILSALARSVATAAATALAVTATMSVAMAAAALFAVTVAAAAFFAVTVAAAALFAVAVTAAAFFAVAVTAAAFFAVAVTAATFFAVAVTAAVTVTATGRSRFDIILKFIGNQSLYGLVGLSFVAGKKRDAGLCERRDGTAAETAADHGVDTVLHEQIHDGRMTMTCARYRFGRRDDTIVNDVELEARSHSEVLEDDVVFAGNCDFHIGNSL